MGTRKVPFTIMIKNNKHTITEDDNGLSSRFKDSARQRIPHHTKQTALGLLMAIFVLLMTGCQGYGVQMKRVRQAQSAQALARRFDASQAVDQDALFQEEKQLKLQEEVGQGGQVLAASSGPTILLDHSEANGKIEPSVSETTQEATLQTAPATLQPVNSLEEAPTEAPEPLQYVEPTAETPIEAPVAEVPTEPIYTEPEAASEAPNLTEAPTVTEAQTTPPTTQVVTDWASFAGVSALNTAPEFSGTFSQWIASQTLPVFLDFRQEGCHNCDIAEPMVRELAAAYNGKIIFLVVDLSRGGVITPPLMSQSLQVTPTFVTYKNGAVVSLQENLTDRASISSMVATLLQ